MARHLAVEPHYLISPITFTWEFTRQNEIKNAQQNFVLLDDKVEQSRESVDT